jgi:CheY-like chemotaxis protein
LIGSARVLLVEDDASIQRFVHLALEPLPVELVSVDNLAKAWAQLQTQQFRLVMTDLMLPDGSGLDLLRALHDNPVLRGDAELAVFSAGVSDVVRERLKQWGVQRVLAKPIALAELERHVLEATVEAPSADECLSEPARGSTESTTDARAAERRAIDTYFGGDTALFEAFRLSCLAQFVLDADQCDEAVASSDFASLRRVTHSLKSVLLTLGHPGLSDQAKQVEMAAASLQPDAASLWLELRAALLRLGVPRA